MLSSDRISYESGSYISFIATLLLPISMTLRVGGIRDSNLCRLVCIIHVLCNAAYERYSTVMNKINHSIFDAANHFLHSYFLTI